MSETKESFYVHSVYQPLLFPQVPNMLNLCFAIVDETSQDSSVLKWNNIAKYACVCGGVEIKG